MNYLRRQQGRKKAKKLLRIYRMRDNDLGDRYYDDGGLLSQRLLRIRKQCSGPCCGNPRKHWKQKTRQELIQLEREREQLESLQETEHIIK